MTQLESSEIINLAHFLHTCLIIIKNKVIPKNVDLNDHQNRAYYDIYQSNNYHDMFLKSDSYHCVTDENIYFDPIVDCCGYTEDDENYKTCSYPKIYSWRLIPFDEITLDTIELLEWMQLPHY